LANAHNGPYISVELGGVVREAIDPLVEYVAAVCLDCAGGVFIHAAEVLKKYALMFASGRAWFGLQSPPAYWSKRELSWLNSSLIGKGRLRGSADPITRGLGILPIQTKGPTTSAEILADEPTDPSGAIGSMTKFAAGCVTSRFKFIKS
jgi:hypothetical protein